VELSTHGERDQPEPCRDSAFLRTELPGSFTHFFGWPSAAGAVS